MSDLDPAYDDANVVPGDFIRQNRRRIVGEAVTSLSDDPEKAARAAELSRYTGDKPALIYGDLDNYEEQLKAQLTSRLLSSNEHLREFIDSDPMAAKIANDDYPNLDEVSQKTKKLDLPQRFSLGPSALASVLWPGDPLKRFTEGGPLGSWLMKDPNLIKNHPFTAATLAGLGTPIELILRGLGGIQDTAADAVTNAASVIDPSLGRDLGAMVQSAGLTGRLDVHNIATKAAEAIGPVRPYLENGREPLPTVLPEYDTYRADLNKQDVDALTDVVKAAQSSALRERSPEMFRTYQRMLSDGDIGIGGDAVVKLYGDKVPTPDDGLLGWVPGIADQLELARRSGDDISVPIADWVARVDPEVMKNLADDIRVRPGNITANEAKLDKELKGEGTKPPPLPEEAPTVRGAAALEPFLSVGDRNIRIEKRPPNMKGDVIGADEFRLLDENGAKVGHLEITPHGDRLYVDNVLGLNGLGPKDFGPALMRSLIKQIKEAYPNAKELGGFRISGMREKFGTEKEVWIKLDRLDEEGFRQILEGGQWETFSPAIRAYIKPDFARSEETRALVDIVTQELDRIVPKKVAIAGAETIKATERPIAGQRAGEDIRIGGAYISYRDAYPTILFALDSQNTLGGARHEAIHHLRQYGFFKQGEWEVLEAQALAGGWFSKYKVDQRYPTANPALKLEEAIAEAYMDWAKQKDTLADRAKQLAGIESPLDTIFRRMKEFFDAVKERISQLLGKEASWEDVFKKVDTGEVGGREGTKPLDARAYDENLSVEEFRRAANDNQKQRIKELEEFSGQSRDSEAEQAAHVDWLAKLDNLSEQMNDILNKETLTEFDKRRLAKLEEEWYNLSDRGSGFDGFDPKLSVEPPSDPSRIFERANALGMTVEQYKRYDKLIQKRHAEDTESASARILAAQKRVQTKEWKANRAEMRAQVAEDINLRPDVAADNYFADGMLYGKKVEVHEKLGTEFLTEEQRAGLPRDYYRKDGVHPDDLAPLFGFPDGATLVEHLSSLSEVRRTSGMRPIEFKRRLIDIETDRQMRLKYGVLEDNIMDAVKEQVASETQLSLLHEETLYYAIKSGQEPAFDKAAVTRWVQDEFEKSPMTSVNSDRYMAAAGRSGRAVENALLKQDFEGAFREKQKQFYSMLLAKEAIQFEAQVAKFEKLAKTLSKREVKAVEPEFLEYIHGLLLEGGVPVKRSLGEIEAGKEFYGHGSLGQFVEAKSRDGYDLDQTVAESLWDAPAKPLEQMTVQEFREFNDAIVSLNHVGRAVRKIEIAGEKADWADFRQKVIDNITQLPARPRDSQGRWLYQIDASLTRMEEIAKDLDLRTELGPLHQAVIEPMMRSKAKEFDLMTDLSKHFRDTRGTFDKAWRKSLNDTIEQDILHDPYTGAAYDMTRENLIQVMLNWGNRSNIRKMVQGAAVARFGRRLDREEFAVYEGQIKALIDKHARLEDWQFVQRMWEPFRGWQDQMDTVARNTTGVAPKWVEISPVETPHGTFEGGYWPVKYDRLGSNATVIEDRRPKDDGVFTQDYFRAATAKGYLKERTGYVDFVDISTSLEQAAGTMQQTIHDIAFRDSLIQGGKVFYDKGIRAAIRKHYGSEYEAQLVPWLRRIAHQFSTDETSIKGYNDFMRRVRINLVGHALPLNLKVILSPDIGVPNPRSWASFTANRSENVKLAMEKSDEIRHLVYNMDRDFREGLDRITLDPNVRDFQKKAVQWGFLPIAKVSQEFRMSTFVDQYHKALGRGKTEQEAALIADSFVRERHGAASIVDLPAVMQSNEAMKMLTMFYGYFNTMYNWQRQLPGNVRRGEWKEFGVNGLGAVVVGAAFGAALFNKQRSDDSWFKVIAKALLLQPLSTVPILNTAASYFAEGYAPRTPTASLLGAAGSIVTDTKKMWKGQPVEKPVAHVANVVGLTTGLPLAQVGRTGQFGMDVAKGKQRPKNITEWARGIITGEAKLKP